MTDEAAESSQLPLEVVSIDQRQETPLSKVTNPRATISYLYTPCRASRSEDDGGQDYVVLGHNERTVSFVVCDGVGESYLGQVAARFLGNALVGWLGALEAVSDENSLASQVTGFLTELTAAGQQHMADYGELEDDLPPLLKWAQEEQRASGSETAFICGSVQFPRIPTDSSDAGRLLLCWLGNAEVQVFDRDGSPLDIGANWTGDDRWSTHHGVMGAEQVHVWLGELGQVSQLIAYSDGLASVRDRLQELVRAPDKLREEVERICDSPTGDDISLVNIEIGTLPAPRLREIRSTWFGSTSLHWNPVPEAGAYLIEESRDPDFEVVRSWVSSGASFRVEDTALSQNYYRVKAIYGGLESEPSNVESARTMLGGGTLKWALPMAIALACLIATVIALEVAKLLLPQ
jgi:hypothetical protein